MPERSERQNRLAAAAADLTVKTIEMQETDEEVVIGKAARVVEEVRKRKRVYAKMRIGMGAIARAEGAEAELQTLVATFDGRLTEAERRIDRVLARLGHE